MKPNPLGATLSKSIDLEQSIVEEGNYVISEENKWPDESLGGILGGALVTSVNLSSQRVMKFNFFREPHVPLWNTVSAASAPEAPILVSFKLELNTFSFQTRSFIS